jgi:hypothetical protein
MKTKKDRSKTAPHKMANEDWIFDPKNKEIVEKIKRALNQKADISIDLDEYDPSSSADYSAEREVAELRKCQLDHIPNAVTMKSMENIEAGKDLEEVCNVEEFFKKLMAP